MGISDKEEERKEMERREDVSVCVGGYSEWKQGLDSEQNTRRGGMNINNILCWKIVTMDIIERRREATGSESHPRPYLLSVCAPSCMRMNTPAIFEHTSNKCVLTVGFCAPACEGVWSFPTVIIPMTVGVCL